MKRLLVLLVVMLPCLVLGGTARALESEAVRSSRVVATLVSDTDRVEAGGALRLGLRLKVAPGWHTYWLNPGDAGAAAEIAWTLPEGGSAGPIQWPAPSRLPEGPVMSYGYTGEVLLPVAVKAGTAGGLVVEASATWLVCEKICVPEEGVFRLALGAGLAGPSSEAALFEAASARVPRASPFAASVGPDGVLSLVGAGLSDATVREAYFYPAAWGAIDQGAPQALTVTDGAVRLSLVRGAEFKLPLEGVLVLRDAGGQETALSVSAVAGDAAAPAAVPLWQTLALAALAGLILNLMPCVFPVLAMKAVSLSRLSGQARGAVRAHAVSYTAGVLVAFAALGGALLVARAAGGVAGWGFQFQSPVFVAGMAFVLFGVGLNLSGVFEVGGRVAGAGQGLAAQGGHAGSFFTGLLAVVVATPCTAPFMGAAIAAALAAPGWVAMLVFLTMGLGLAAPYALLAAAPALARGLPKPGAWMDVLKGVLAFPMYAAAAWLLWVVSLEAGPQGVLVVGSGLVLIGFAAWALGLAQRRPSEQSGRRLGVGAAAVAALSALALLGGVQGVAPAAAQVEAGVEPWSPARLAALRAEGRPVFVNMTAAWCVTCLVNERVALSPEPVRAAFRARGVAYLKGDWTRGDAAISAYLREHARDGVPLYVWYPAKGPPEVLPQVLTEGAMLSRLNEGG